LRGAGSERTKLPNLLQTKKKQNILHELGLFLFERPRNTLLFFSGTFKKVGDVFWIERIQKVIFSSKRFVGLAKN